MFYSLVTSVFICVHLWTKVFISVYLRIKTSVFSLVLISNQASQLV